MKINWRKSEEKQMPKETPLYGAWAVDGPSGAIQDWKIERFIVTKTGDLLDDKDYRMPVPQYWIPADEILPEMPPAPKGKLKIGLSLSACIADVLYGNVAVEDIAKIISGTKAETDDDWAAVFQNCKDNYWHRDPERGEKIAKYLIAQGKVEQPRLQPDGRYANIARSHWVDSESEIQWDEP